MTRGERTASAMEQQLTSLERKINDLLASVDNGDVGNGDMHAGKGNSMADAEPQREKKVVDGENGS